MSTKRHKRQSCNSGQMANYYSKYQLGKFSLLNFSFIVGALSEISDDELEKEQLI